MWTDEAMKDCLKDSLKHRHIRTKPGNGMLPKGPASDLCYIVYSVGGVQIFEERDTEKN